MYCLKVVTAHRVELTLVHFSSGFLSLTHCTMEYAAVMSVLTPQPPFTVTAPLMDKDTATSVVMLLRAIHSEV